MVVIGLEIGDYRGWRLMGIRGGITSDDWGYWIDKLPPKFDDNFISNIGKKLNGFFHSILTHPGWGSCLGFGRTGVVGVVGRNGDGMNMYLLESEQN
jgi:hypothetical protein